MIASFLNDPLPVAASLAGTDECEELRLVQAAQGGCEHAFRALVERHQQRIYHFCHHYLRDADDAREACQDTFVRAHRALGRFKPRARLSTWLFQIALNLCRDRLRARQSAVVALEDHPSEPACGRATPDEAAMHGADLAKLDRGLLKLPEKLRTVLVLSCLDGLSHAECAEILKCSERAVEGRLYRARQRLAKWWENEN